MDGIGEMLKIVIFRKVNSGQLVVYSPLEFSEAVTNLFCQFTLYTYQKNENIVAPEDKSNAWKINQTSKIQKLERNCSQNGDTSIFSKLVIMRILFRCSGLGGDKGIICGHVETSESDECAKCQGSCNEGEEWLCCPVCHQWSMKTVFMTNVSHTVYY